ncbi:MAG: ABC transporter ATP-binding protein [Acidobacteria bacterium]|nr:ABC transporter ATP-binding protein [Acidobacteriota bacterium]MDA1236156.1 ABC transporter ATP-binding protein [Acidobacteriota bacterium]
MAGQDQALIVKGLGKQYATPGEPLVVLRNVDLELNRGDAMSITGPSGSGKSTLLYILGSLEQPTSGTFRLGEQEPLKMSAEGLAVYRNRSIGFIFQDHHLLPQLTALQNVLLPSLASAPADPAEVKKRAQGLLDRVGLADRATHLPAELSGGERQRVAIARALIHRPALLLADEPTGNLDRKRADEVSSLLLELQREENSILIVVTHSMELAERHPLRAELIDGALEMD